jgi:REP element-mobilizing transposase RayT
MKYHASPFIHALLVAHGLGNFRATSIVDESGSSKVSQYLTEYAAEKGIYMKINFVNADHAHVLVDLPATMAMDEVAQLLKGASSHWVNESNLVPGKFGWQRGYGAFSVSHSGVDEVCGYIAKQEEHHRKRPFAEELKQLVERYGLR